MDNIGLIIVFVIYIVLPTMGYIHKKIINYFKYKKKLEQAIIKANCLSIININGFISFYSKKMDSLKPWLNKRPDIMNIPLMNEIDMKSRKIKTIKRISEIIWDKHILPNGIFRKIDVELNEELKLKDIFYLK